MEADAQVLLTKEIAQNICDILTEESGYPVLVTDKDGIIFAASDRKRIGNFHPVAKKVVDGVIDEGIVTKDEEIRSGGVTKAGINIPVVYDGVRIANMGITGDPGIVRPVVGVASRITQMLLKNDEQVKVLSHTIEELNTYLQEISATVEEISTSAQQVASASQDTYRITTESKDKMKSIFEVLNIIKHIASQSNLIGLNAAIEAARVGEAGRGFSVVANEVRKLATSSSESVEAIGKIVNEVQNLFLQITSRVEQNKEVTYEQSVALTSVTQRIQSIEHTIAKLMESIHS
ncbi:methyl-accepting chemotaxis protein [Fodinisporobacter ferrooxydans]|uniref:methyl-accepting chemotaxis protein n=1 Tax=Fodinisporobacter ferrooxydans TaxID=2901836 RepID=UPI003242E260